MKKPLLTIAVLFSLLVILVSIAEVNYNRAIDAASFHTDGTDLEIEQKMHEYGFEIDAMDCKEPSFNTKVKALFN